MTPGTTVCAYVIRDRPEALFSDDGEPQGTAGQPILNVLEREGVQDVLCVVTRYFGGILLGAGGLCAGLYHRARRIARGRRRASPSQAHRGANV
ncbi:MAG: YigZ family protein [Oscillospiraceae bacterium]